MGISSNDEVLINQYGEDGMLPLRSGAPTPPPCNDSDNDGHSDPASPLCPHPEQDCDDSNSNVNPGASDNCGNGIDDNCNGSIDGPCRLPRRFDEAF